MNQGIKLFMMAVGVLLSLSLLGAGFYLYNNGMGLFDRGKTQVIGKASVATATQFAPYQNKFVTGQEVLDVVTTYSQTPAFSVKIVTGNSAAAGGYYMNNAVGTGGTSTTYAEPTAGNPVDTTVTSTALPTYTLAEMQNTSNAAAYINPTGRFFGQIYADAGNEVRLIVFTQR